MFKRKAKNQPVSDEPQRRLSPWRVMFALCLVAGIAYGSQFGVKAWKDTIPAASTDPWFASYVDVTATPTYGFEQVDKSQVMLAFIVASPNDSCKPTWGGAYTLDEASDRLDIDRRIARLRQQGGDVAISFGGLLNSELALKCTDTDKLAKAYNDVIDQYKIEVIDFDLEKANLSDKDSSIRRAKVIAAIQAKRRAENKHLAVWLTLPVAPQGLTEEGTNAVSYMLQNGVDLAGINVMTMDYGDSRAKGQSMLDASTAALNQTHRQLGILYDQANIHLNMATIWSKIGATPMIGQNDIPGEIFTTKDAKAFNEFAKSRNIGRISMWSANRDIKCGSNYVNLKAVSDSCSGVDQQKLEFTNTLGANFTGSLASSADIVTRDDPSADTKKQETDDPTTSPYQIWKDSGAYLQGTKVVWHKNVYQAKWWTQGDVPDNPVLQAYQTPWELIGPVLPGEKPIPQATLPEGTYPQWTGNTAYETGSRVLFNGIPYQAKWWNQGNSPAAASSNADGSPWVPLTQAQINEVIKEKSVQTQ